MIEKLIRERRRTEPDDLLGVLLSTDALDDETVRDQLVTFLFAGHETTALDTVIKETLRLYPPAYLVYREPRHDVALDGYRIPRGTTLQLPAYTVHQDPRWWNEPDAFVPDRWTGTTTRPEYA